MMIYIKCYLLKKYLDLSVMHIISIKYSCCLYIYLFMCVYISVSLTMYLFIHSPAKVIDMNCIILQIIYQLLIQYQFLHTKESTTQKNKSVQNSGRCQFLLEHMLFMLLEILIKLCFPPYLSVSIIQALLTLRRNVYVLFQWKHMTIRVDTFFPSKIKKNNNNVEEYPLAT